MNDLHSDFAFAMHGVRDLFEIPWQQARRTLGARVRLFEYIRSIAGHLVCATWEALFNTLVTDPAAAT